MLGWEADAARAADEGQPGGVAEWLAGVMGRRWAAGQGASGGRAVGAADGGKGWRQAWREAMGQQGRVVRVLAEQQA